MKYGQYKFNRGKYSTADLEEGVSAITSNSSVANVAAVRVRTSGALSAGVTVITTLANVKAVAQVQLTVSSSASCAAEKVFIGSATATVAATPSSAGQRIHQGNSTNSFGIYGISTIATTTELIMLASASVTNASSVSDPRGGFQHTANIVDITSSSAIVSSGRLKWQSIEEGTKTWTLIAA